MGTIVHKTVIVTGVEGYSDIDEVYLLAKETFGKGNVSEMMGPYINGHQTFMIPTVGSKVGWEDYIDHIDNIDYFLRRCYNKNVDVVVCTYGEVERVYIKDVKDYYD